ncbi:hypothetical protein ACFOUV_16695 [Oceanobacillus longus]|uniref:YtxH domain-containing protein n=1 Tax=Oceanobacillus longus TaxID=930120 RepID=A0ABV8GZY9_9BACI
MKKRYLLSAVGAMGASVAGYYLKDEKNRNKIKEVSNGLVGKIKGNTDSTFENAGVPDQSSETGDIAQLENSKMVSEGSQFGVQYYNDKKDENKLANQQD